MKKLIVAILTFVLSCSLSYATSTETTTAFDHTILNQYEGYSYDKFEKQWELYGAFAKEYSDAFIVVAIKAFGTKTTADGVYFYAWFRDGDNLNKIRTINEILILADDTLITLPMYAKDSADYSPITGDYAHVLKTIYEAKEVTIRLCTDMYNYDFDSTDYDMTALLNACGIISRNNLVQYAKDSSWANGWKTWRFNNPITIEE